MDGSDNRGHVAGGRWRGLRDHVPRLLKRPAWRALLAAQVVVLAVILVRGAAWLQPLELLAYDTLTVAWAGSDTSQRILLVGATEHDITMKNPDGKRRWGWPLRDGDLAALLERLASWKPRAIGVDLYRDIPEAPGTDRLDAVLKAHPEIFWVFKLGDGRSAGISPPAVLEGSDRAVLADTVPDPDEVVRRGLLFADDGKNNYPSLGTALASFYLAPEHLGLEPGNADDLRLGPATIVPLDASRGPYMKIDSRGYQILLDYKGGPQRFPMQSLSAIMDDNLAAVVRGRIVIVGVMAESVKDDFPTPFSTGFGSAGPISGIAIHAQLADQLIREAHGDSRVLTGMSRPLEDVWIWAWAMGGAMLGLFVRAAVPGAIGVVSGIAAIAGIVYFAFGQALLLPAVPAMFAWVGAGVISNQLLYAASNRARARLRRSFEHYLPPAVIAQMIEADRLPSVGGERREISALFTDVAGFTTFSEARDPEELANITNAYFDGVCAAIFEHGGLVNAFIGDGVLAFFGAPHYQPDHADRAIAAALHIDRFAQGFAAEQNVRGVEFGETRIGIHTGIAFVGNVGARERLQYTALGDMLNTASRLEGLNKAIGSRICASREIVGKCGRYRFRPVGSFVLKGRQGATDVFAPIDPERQPPDRIERYTAAFQALVEEAPHAKELFEELYQEDPQDPCVTFHLQRLKSGQFGVFVEMPEK